MVIHVHTRTLAYVNLVFGQFGLTGRVVRSHVDLGLEFRQELEPEMKNAPKKVNRHRIVMDQEVSAAELVRRGRHGQLALQHVLVELNQEVVHVVQVHVPMRHKIDLVMVMLCAVVHVPNGLTGVLVV